MKAEQTCSYCETKFKITKKDVKREIAFRKGEHVEYDSYYPRYKLIKRGIFSNLYKKYYTKHVFEALKLRENLFFICPLCEEKTYLKIYKKPNFFIGWNRVDEWKKIEEKEIKVSYIKN